MKTLEAVGNNFYVAPVQKKLACRGSSNSTTVCFKLDRYSGKTDLSECNCTIKTKNSEGKSDLVIPEVTTDDKKLYINWTLSSGATAAAGELLVQVQLEKIFDDSSQNINWQSNIMEFEIVDSLDAADEINDQDPTIFQQWEEKVNTLYADAAADVQSMQALQIEVQTDADAVAQQKQSVEQTAAQAAQSAQDASESAQSAQTSAQSAQTQADTAQELAQGYSNSAKTYSDTASESAQSAQTSAQSAQTQADTAQEAALQAQQKVDAFSGYTKEEIDNGFACALIGEAAGHSVTLDDVQPNTTFRSLLITGQTVETGTGDKSPDNPYILAGTNALTVSDGGSQSQAIELPQRLNSLPDGTADQYDAVSGVGLLKIGSVTLNGSENWILYTGGTDETYLQAYVQIPGMQKYSGINIIADKLIPETFSISAENIYGGTGSSFGAIFIKILKSRLSTQDLSGFKVWLAENPTKVLYKLENPQSFQSAPRQVSAFSPVSALSADSGTIAVQYRRDLGKELEKMKAAIQSLGGSSSL